MNAETKNCEGCELFIVRVHPTAEAVARQSRDRDLGSALDRIAASSAGDRTCSVKGPAYGISNCASPDEFIRRR